LPFPVGPGNNGGIIPVTLNLANLNQFSVVVYVTLQNGGVIRLDVQNNSRINFTLPPYFSESGFEVTISNNWLQPLMAKQ
jgi:hypothetical protein